MHRSSVDISGGSNRSSTLSRNLPSSPVIVKPKGSQRSFLSSLWSSMSTQSTSSRVHITSKENDENDIEELSRSAASSLIAAVDPSSMKNQGTLSAAKSSLYQQSNNNSSSWRFRASPASTENNSSSSRKYIPTDHGNHHHRSGLTAGAKALEPCHSEGALSPHEDEVEEFPLLTSTAMKKSSVSEDDLSSLNHGLQDIEDVDSHEAHASMV